MAVAHTTAALVVYIYEKTTTSWKQKKKKVGRKRRYIKMLLADVARRDELSRAEMIIRQPPPWLF